MLLLGCIGLLYSAGALADEEVYLADLAIPPTIHLDSPVPGEGYGQGNTLLVSAKGTNLDKIEVTLSWEGDALSEIQEGAIFEHTFQLPKLTSGLTITVTGTAPAKEGISPATSQVIREVPSPKEALIGRMLDLAFKNSKDSKYKFAPAEEDWDIGVCKNFVMRLFDTFSKDYAMAEYPDLVLHMPKNNSKAACAPYDYGIEWRPEGAADGSPFEIVAQFKYNNDLTKEENAQIARDMLHQVQKGDFFQMVGNYGGGNGPHSLLFMADYNPLNDMLHWTDSNMRGTRVNGVRWGYLQYDADATAEWFIQCINMKKRGATLYRLRDDLFYK